MTVPGKLIAVEGIDGSGKQTQVRLLAEALGSHGHQVFVTGFPQYDSWFGSMVGQFLNGDFGPIYGLDPRITAMLYAGDRFERKGPIVSALSRGDIVIADRYVASNLAHQTARAAPDKRDELRGWIEHLEYGIYGLPKEELVLYLRVTPHHAQRLVAKKAARSYTESAHDILEADLTHLQHAMEMYDFLAKRANWKTIDCYDGTSQTMRAPEHIATQVLAATTPTLASLQEHH